MKKWFIPLLALWLYGCYAGPGEEAIRTQFTAKLQADTDANLFEISDFAILDKEERMEGVYLVKVSYQLHFKQGMEQLQVLHDEFDIEHATLQIESRHCHGHGLHA